MYSKVAKGTSNSTETTTGNRNKHNIISLIRNTHGTVYHWRWIYMARCSRNKMPERHSLPSLSVNIHGSVQQKSKHYARKAQSILHLEYTWLVTEEIKCQKLGRRSLSLTLDIHDSVQQNSNWPGRQSLYLWRWIYMVQCIRNQMLGTHSLSLTLNIHGSVRSPSLNIGDKLL